jgi:hypothetical protein
MTRESIEKYHRKKSHKVETIEECPLCQTQKRKCQGKHYRFDDRLEAAIHLVKVNVERKKRGATPRLSLYQCKWCDQWHYNTPPQRGQARRTKSETRKEMIIRELERRSLLSGVDEAL